MMGHLICFPVLLGALHNVVTVNVPWKNIAKYVGASAIMALILIAGHPVTRISTLIFTDLGALTYLSLLVAIDKETRNLAKIILETLKTRFGRSF
jgi:hypothetical protein